MRLPSNSGLITNGRLVTPKQIAHDAGTPSWLMKIDLITWGNLGGAATADGSLQTMRFLDYF
ncbi:MAG TPA: hypothetical protein QF355_03960 [Candidatus Marinimicrobia bacterium]|jgi:hypothetical protein|nr:hypothetical protein [Candidatus Neomarinimicrobiota bacterium]|tara:strand:- start:666 stop:851 length:186 start_codon:yes stop_codon:yes gene_type:complete